MGLRFAPLPPTLDGMAYMAEATYRDEERDLDLPSDWRAIRWMLENVDGTPVILEGSAPLYHWGSRYSIYTGLPTVLGWDWHQKQQRIGYTERVDQRQREVNRFYETPDSRPPGGRSASTASAYIVVGASSGHTTRPPASRSSTAWSATASRSCTAMGASRSTEVEAP